MANLLDLLTQETIEIALHSGMQRVSAHRHQDFAVHCIRDGSAEDWRLTHLPSGHLVIREVLTFENAVSAMFEVARLRNDWAVIRQEDITLELKKKVEEIAIRYGGSVPQSARPISFDRNGYAGLSP